MKTQKQKRSLIFKIKFNMERVKNPRNRNMYVNQSA